MILRSMSHSAASIYCIMLFFSLLCSLLHHAARFVRRFFPTFGPAKLSVLFWRVSPTAEAPSRLFAGMVKLSVRHEASVMIFFLIYH